MQAPLPQDRAWNAVNNSYDRRGYEKICDEFGVSPHSDWKVSGPNQGFGQAFNYFPDRGYCLIGDGEYLPDKMSFIQKANDDFHVDYIKQETDAVSRAWRLFILNQSDGFTRSRVNRLNDSIMTYVWAVLSAQALVRTGILGVGRPSVRKRSSWRTSRTPSMLLWTFPIRLDATRISCSVPALRSTSPSGRVSLWLQVTSSSAWVRQ